MTDLAGTADEDGAVLDQLMMSLGYVMLHWSQLERAVLDEIKRLRSAEGDTGESSIRARGAFTERLAEWRALVSLKSRRNLKAAKEVGEIASHAERLRRIRNLLAHHFIGIEKDQAGEYSVLVSEGGVSSLRSTHAAYTAEQISQLVKDMADARARVLRLPTMLSE